MHALAEVLTALTSMYDEGDVEYITSKRIADETGLSPRKVAPRLQHLKYCDHVDITLEPWSKNQSSTTFKFTIEDASSVRNYLDRITNDDDGEPTLNVGWNNPNAGNENALAGKKNAVAESQSE